MVGPIFIVGARWSGSSLLRLILDAHPRLAIGAETGFMGALAATKAIPDWRYGREWYGRIEWSEHELDSRLRRFYSTLFERYASSRGKARWGDETPLHSWHIADMARIFPDSVFVAVVRHPLAVLHERDRSMHDDVLRLAAYWESTNIEILRQGAMLGSSRFALVRYEDFINCTEQTLGELTSWLGEPGPTDVLCRDWNPGPTVARTSASDRQSGRCIPTGQPVEPLHGTTYSVAVARLARFLGYDPHVLREPVAIVPIGIGRDRKIVTGDVVARLQREHAGTLSFEQREPPVLAHELGVAELVKRVQRAEWELNRVRRRPVVQFCEAVERLRRRPSWSGVAEVATILRQRFGPGASLD